MIIFLIYQLDIVDTLNQFLHDILCSKKSKELSEKTQTRSTSRSGRRALNSQFAFRTFRYSIQRRGPVRVFHWPPPKWCDRESPPSHTSTVRRRRVERRPRRHVRVRPVRSSWVAGLQVRPRPRLFHDHAAATASRTGKPGDVTQSRSDRERSPLRPTPNFQFRNRFHDHGPSRVRRPPVYVRVTVDVVTLEKFYLSARKFCEVKYATRSSQNDHYLRCTIVTIVVIVSYARCTVSIIGRRRRVKNNSTISLYGYIVYMCMCNYIYK